MFSRGADKAVTRLARFLTFAGAINWGLVGLFKYNLMRRIGRRSPATERTIYGLVGLSAIWLAVRPFVRMMMLARMRYGAEETMYRMQPMVGQRMPTLEGETLSGNHVTLPADVMGHVTYLCCVFNIESRIQGQMWTRPFVERYGQRAGVNYYVAPIVGRMGRILARVIGMRMRRILPAEMHGHALIIPTPAEQVRNQMGASDASSVWIYLIDRGGTVRYQYGGPFSEYEFNRLISVTESCLQAEQPGEERAAA